jgi:hypothetical protein
VGRIALSLVLLVVAGCFGIDEKRTGVPARTSEDACTGRASPHTPAEVVVALRRHGISASAPSDACEDGQRPVNGLLGDGLAGQENAVYCFVAATPAAQRDSQLFKDQVRQGNVLCNTNSARVHKRVAAALRELPR